MRHGPSLIAIRKSRTLAEPSPGRGRRGCRRCRRRNRPGALASPDEAWEIPLKAMPAAPSPAYGGAADAPSISASCPRPAARSCSSPTWTSTIIGRNASTNSPRSPASASPGPGDHGARHARRTGFRGGLARARQRCWPGCRKPSSPMWSPSASATGRAAAPWWRPCAPMARFTALVSGGFSQFTARCARTCGFDVHQANELSLPGAG